MTSSSVHLLTTARSAAQDVDAARAQGLSLLDVIRLIALQRDTGPFAIHRYGTCFRLRIRIDDLHFHIVTHRRPESIVRLVQGQIGATCTERQKGDACK